MFKKLVIIFVIIASLCSLYGEKYYLETLIKSLDKVERAEDKVKLLNDISLEYMLFDNLKSNEYAKKSLKLNNDKLITEKIKSLYIIGFNESAADYLKRSDTIENSNKLLKENKIDDKDLIAFSYFINGASHIQTQDKSKAFEDILEANNLYYELDDQVMFNLTKAILSFVHIYLGQYKKAISLIKESNTYFVENRMYKYIVLTTKYMAYFNELQGNKIEAERLYKVAINYSKDNYNIILPYLSNGLITFYINNNEAEKAIEIYKNNIEGTVENLSTVQQADTYSNLLNISILKEDFDEALKYSDMIFNLNFNNRVLTNRTKNSVGYILLKTGNLRGAEENLLNVWNNLKQDEYTPLMGDNLSYITELNLVQSNYKGAYSYTNLHLNKIKEYNKSASYLKLIEAEEEYQIQQKDRDIDEARAIQKFRLKAMFIISVLLVILIISISMQLRTVYKDKKIFESMARKDYLTDLYNRRTFIEKVEEENIRFLRSGNWYSIVIADIDGFKMFNDTYGHECGDEVIKIVSKTLKHTCRKQDVVARWGGEEYIILLPSTSITGAKVIAERFREHIESIQFVFNDKKLGITMTFGVTEFHKGQTMEQMIHNADIAMLRGKESGKNVVITYEELDEE